MIPAKNEYVKVYMNNGFAEEGFVQGWGDTVVLLSRDKSSLVVIKDPSSIFLYRILIDKKEHVVSDVYVDKDLEPRKYHREPVDRALDLAELYKLKSEEERKRARQKLTEFRPTGASVDYDNFSILRDESLLRNSTEKDR